MAEQESKDDSIYFPWWKSLKGYHVVRGVPFSDTSAKREEWICDKGVPTQAKPFFPMEEKELFVKFADIEETGITNFANQYGLLTSGEMVLEAVPQDQLTRKEALYLMKLGAQTFTDDQIICLPEAEHRIDSKPLHGEQFSIWREEIEKMKEAYGLWVGSTSTSKVQLIINDCLRERVSPRLLIDSTSKNLWRYLVPENLLGGLWLQFADAVTGNRKVRECAICLRTYLVGGGLRGGFREDKGTCGDNCRGKLSRRRTSARKLFADGLPDTEIAMILRINPNIVQTWRITDQPTRSKGSKTGK